jgi:hypothetical protein
LLLNVYKTQTHCETAILASEFNVERQDGPISIAVSLFALDHPAAENEQAEGVLVLDSVSL